MHLDQADLVNQIVIEEKGGGMSFLRFFSERKASAATHEETAALPVHSGIQSVFRVSLKV